MEMHAGFENAVTMHNLMQKLELAHAGGTLNIIAFIAARAHEGTSTIAREYSLALAAQTHQKVLLIDAATHSPESTHGIVETFIAHAPITQAIHSLESGVSHCRWMSNPENRSQSAKLIHNAALWGTLAESFDIIVIDAPSLQHSFDGVALASKADATVLVIEAESTPEPVVINLRDTLTAAGAKIAGIVMNKRRYHIPQKIYKRL